jgi:hypothetical protein
MGQLLAQTAYKAYQRRQYSENTDFECRVRRLPLPMRRPTDEQMAEAKKVVRENPAPPWSTGPNPTIDWSWVYAHSRLCLEQTINRQPELDCEIQIFRIGPIALVAIPGEPFVEGQLKIKLGSPFYPTYGVGGCNSHIGYIPTVHAFKGSGYETHTGNWSKLVSEALEKIADTTIDMLKEMKSNKQ